MRRRKQLRLKEYDYSSAGAYFVTICTKDREEIFGEIVDGSMRRNIFGDIVQTCWNELPQHYSHIQIDEFVIMPNHVHGIIIINDHDSNDTVGATHASPLRGKHTLLGDVVGSFKSAATKGINIVRHMPQTPVWQRGYYDHVIRNEQSLKRIREYITTNAERWDPEEGSTKR